MEQVGVEKGKAITVERWLQRMWLPPERSNNKKYGQPTKPRRALTVVKKKQGVPCLLVQEEDKWDTCTKLAEDKESGEAIMAFYRKITNLQDKVTPGKDRVMVVPTEAWKKMTGSNLFVTQFGKKEDSDGVDFLAEETQKEIEIRQEHSKSEDYDDGAQGMVRK